MSARNLTAFALSAAVGVVTGIYIFRPAIEEQQKSSEFWRDPGQPKPDNVLRDDKTTIQGRSDEAPKRSDQEK
ncbi:hypothetical protein VSDG_00719 [Cytospora chrysosperma]|uniref:Uncharacterized protein n=1 Tax=Cytospora chrysosperma TaxID=252740 RepID=A0A423WM30_CYTCH|nr:hypothetical protein VSDG_00719 [Valsa sordida]